MRLWRICDERFVSTAFDGAGAATTGGRWNSRGGKVVYAARNLSTAILEVLVHVDPANAPDTLVKIPVDVPHGVRHEVVRVTDLPANWKSYPAPHALARIGDQWLAAGSSALLFVPSVVVGTDDESNVLLNPQHGDFARLSIGEAERLILDPRLSR